MPDNQPVSVPTGENMADAEKITHKIDDAEAYGEDSHERGDDNSAKASGHADDGI